VEKITSFKSDKTRELHNKLVANVKDILGDIIPDGYKIKEIQIDIYNGETRLIISSDI
jgi:hypothetical protein